MCLLWVSLLLFWAKNSVAELSQKIFNGLEIESTIWSPEIKLLNQIVCDVASNHDTNSAFVVEVATNDCFTLLQDIAPSSNMKTYPDVDFLKSGL